MRFIAAISLVWFAALLTAKQDTYQETLYPSHTCEGGHSWYMVSGDSDSVTVACYQPDPDDPSH